MCRDEEVQMSSYKNSHRGIEYSIGNAVNSIIMAMYRLRWIARVMEESLHKIYKCPTIVLYTQNYYKIFKKEHSTLISLLVLLKNFIMLSTYYTTRLCVLTGFNFYF